jgi:hypothetical protein
VAAAREQHEALALAGRLVQVETTIVAEASL